MRGRVVEHACAQLAVLALTVSGSFGYANDGELGGPHRRINDLALDRLIAEVAPKDSILQWYRFDPIKVGHQLDVTGVAVIKSGQFYPEDVAKAVAWVRAMVSAIAEGNREESFRWWLVEGGYSADEPEVFQAVRHFYDPTRTGVLTTGKQTEKVAFLSDMATGKLGFINPRMDLKQWALTASPYSLATAARALDLAGVLWPANRPGQAPFLAKCWRSLGEALHLLADMTVPAHVRNDAHPPVEGLDAFFPDWSADPYETMVTAAVVNANAGHPVPPEAAADMAKADTPEALFEAVARYTNRSFFSRDTVSGKDAVTGKPVKNANGQPSYPSPRLDQYEYGQLKDSGRWFYKQTAENVMIAERVVTDGKVTHEIDRSLAWQARQLIPLAVAADARLLELALPRVKVVLEGLDPVRKILRCKAVLCHRQGGVDQPVRLVLPTHQDHVLVFVTLSDRETKGWAPLGEVRGNGFEVAAESALPAELTDILSGKQPAPNGGVSLQVGLNMGGILVLSPPYRPKLPEPKVPAPPRPEPATGTVAGGDPITLQEAIQATRFPEQPKPGDQQYGFTYQPSITWSNPAWTLAPGSHWAKVIDHGVVHYVSDYNSNKKRDGADQDRHFDHPWAAWYTARISGGYGQLPQEPGPDGLWPGIKDMITVRRWAGRVLDKGLNLGDVAAAEDFTAPPDEYPDGYRDTYEVMVARGPLMLHVTVQLHLQGQLQGWSFSRQHGGYRLLGDAPEATFWIDWPGGAKVFAKKIDGWREAIPRVTYEVARQAVKQWETWYLRRVGPSTGLKGLYPLDYTRFWLPPESLPGLKLRANDQPPQPGAVGCSGSFELPNPAWKPGGDAYPQTYGYFGYSVFIFPFDSETDSADSVLAEAGGYYARRVGEFKRPRPYALPGADEAAEFYYRHYTNNHTLLFRYANLVGWVNASDSRPKAEAPVPLVREMARLLLARMKGETPAPLKPAEPLKGIRWGQLALRELNLTDGKTKSPVRTERLGAEAIEQVTKVSLDGTTLTLSHDATNSDAGYQVKGTLTAVFNDDATKLLKLTVSETRTEGVGTPEARRRTWQATASGDFPAAGDADELTALVPMLKVTLTDERGGKVFSQHSGGGAGTLVLRGGL